MIFFSKSDYIIWKLNKVNENESKNKEKMKVAVKNNEKLKWMISNIKQKWITMKCNKIKT